MTLVGIGDKASLVEVPALNRKGSLAMPLVALEVALVPPAVFVSEDSGAVALVVFPGALVGGAVFVAHGSLTFDTAL